MKQRNKQKDHPEVTDIEHICDISPKTKNTKGVCEKVNDKPDVNQKNSSHKEKSNKKNKT